MTTLYKRATPRQAKLLRMIEGAYLNAADAHPESLPRNASLARSIAKRAVGTVTSQWRDLLAVPRGARSDGGAGHLLDQRANVSGQCGATAGVNVGGGISTAGVGEAENCRARSRGASHSARRAPLALLEKRISVMTGEARRAGQIERRDALIDVLRLIAAVLKDEPR